MAHYECPIRHNSGRQESSAELVPGDLIEVPTRCILPCDLILIDGKAIVDEAMLTGESVPVIKNSNIDEVYTEESSKCTLLGGTRVI